jgi:predicted DsbA family dithiol-disulfide isomerase
MTVDVQIWSDVACPWCYVGKRRFEQAVERFRAEGGDVSVTYRSFELSPETPVDFEGDEVDFLARHKGMQRDQVVTMLDQMTVVAADEGLDYDFAALQHTNTVLAHQLLHLARSHGQQAAMKERLLAAYFVEGRHVGRVADLADLAAEVGLDRDEVVAALESGAHLDDVRADQQRAVELGIRGVPFFVLDDRLGVSGAQDPEVLLGALRQAAEGSA